MHRLRLSVALVIAFVAAAAHAQVSLNSVRQTQSGPELFLNFGATAAAAKAAGGTVTREASQYGTSGIFIAFVADPEGNQIELIQAARR